MLNCQNFLKSDKELAQYEAHAIQSYEHMHEFNRHLFVTWLFVHAQVLDFRLRLNSDREQLMYSAYAMQCYEHMRSIKDTHPATLQAGAQLYLLKQNDLDPKLNIEEFELAQRPSVIM